MREGYKPNPVYAVINLGITLLQCSLRSTRGHKRAILNRFLILHRMGFAMPFSSLKTRWALTPPFHPYLHKEGGIFSAALSVASRRPAVNRHPALWCSDFPHSLSGRATAPPSLTERIRICPSEVNYILKFRGENTCSRDNLYHHLSVLTLSCRQHCTNKTCNDCNEDEDISMKRRLTFRLFPCPYT